MGEPNLLGGASGKDPVFVCIDVLLLSRSSVIAFLMRRSF